MRYFLWVVGMCLSTYATAMLTPDEMIAQGNESLVNHQAKTAEAYYLRAAERGNRTAQLQLGLWYLSGKFSAPSAPNLLGGQFWLQEALKPRAFNGLDLVGVSYNASFYQSNLGSDLAVAWLVAGAKQGDARARSLLLGWYMGVLDRPELSRLTLDWLGMFSKVR